MKQSVKFISGNWLLPLLVMLIGISGASNAQIVTNGSFESSPVGVVSDLSTGTVNSYAVKGWFIQVQAGAAKYEIVNDTVQQGSRAMKVTVNTLGVNAWDIQIVADSLPVKPGATYNYSIWAKAQKPGAVVSFTMGNYSYTEYGTPLRNQALTTQWQKYTMQFKVNDTQTWIRGPIHFSYAGDVNNSIYLDNLQITDVDAGKKPVVVEAEAGKVGSNYSVLKDGVITYISPKTNWTAIGNPGDSIRTDKLTVTFSDSGYYNLFVHMRVGPNGYDDDSFFYGNGFGTKNDTANSDWVLVNGVASAGFSDSSAWVDGPGSLGNSIWKWVNVTKNGYQSATGAPFYVSPDSLTKTFEIGSREDGLDIDKIAFGKNWLYFTVRNLDSVQNGATSMSTVVTGTIWTGPPMSTGSSKFIGCTYNTADLNFTNYWTQVTPGNAGKWGSVAGSSSDSSKWNWGTLDAAYALAVQNRIPFKDHCLVWGQQQPAWMTAAGMDSASQAKAVEQWIRMVGNRYPRMSMIDVVNEPIISHNPAPYRNALGGAGATGWDWVVWAFQKARLYMPGVKLLINDYGIINDNVSTTAYLQIINVLNSKGLIDGIGVQGHRFELENGDTVTFKNNLDRLAATGLPIYISEFDLGNPGNSGTPDDNQQLLLYQKIFPVLWRHPGVKGITIWDYLEGQTWQTTCYLVRADGTARPALLWLAQYVKNNPTGVELSTSGLPTQFQLEQNFPNPFNPTTTIHYSISKTSPVSLKVYDMLGREVQTLVNTMQSPGQYTVTLNAQTLGSGVYFYRLNAGNFTETKKLMLVK